MRRVVATFIAFTLFYAVVAFVLRGRFGIGSAIAVGGTGVAAVLILGAPAFALYLRNGWLAWWQFAVGGGAAGLLCTLPFAVGGGALVTALAPAFLGLGVVHATVFWLLAIWRNAELPGYSRRHPVDVPPAAPT